MIDLSQKKEGLKGIDVEQSKSQGRAPSLMSPADLNSMQTTAIDIGISNRTSAVKIGQIELAKQMGKGGLAKKNSRNSSTHRFSMTLNNIQFRKLGTI